MSEESHIISRFSEFTTWISSLENLDEKQWMTPISESKWSVSEIIAHLMNWDKHLLIEILPAVRDGQDMYFPDFDTFNKFASDYVKSGIAQKDLLKETKTTRERLIKELKEIPVETLSQHINANDISHCPSTGTPYSLLYIIEEFTEHDQHHKRQVTQFLNDHANRL